MKSKIRVGIQYKHWLVLEDLGMFKCGRLWKCLCTLCGVTRQPVRDYNLRAGKSAHCLKCNPGRPAESPEVQVGEKIGWWTVLSEAESGQDKLGRRSHRRFLCRCRCGTERILRHSQLRVRGKAKYSSLSCGCGRTYHAALTMMLKHQNIMSPSVKAMFSEFEKERSDDGIDRKHTSTNSVNDNPDSRVVSVA